MLEKHLTYVVEPCDIHLRLDQFLAQKLKDLFSRTFCKRLIQERCVNISHDPAYLLKEEGAVIRITLPDIKKEEPKPEAASSMPLDILYEDDAIIVLNKPAGLVVHPAPGHWEGTLVHALAAHCPEAFSFFKEKSDRPGIVHRLDKETSGLMVIAKHDRSLAHLARQFAAHGRDGHLKKAYKALVWGAFIPKNGLFSAPIGRHPSIREKMTVHGRAPREAVTHYKLRKTFFRDERALISSIDFYPETGRMHQIRVHAASNGSPIVADKVYGKGFETKKNLLPPLAVESMKDLKRHALHAYSLSFLHPLTHHRLTFEIDWPDDIKRLALALSLD